MKKQYRYRLENDTDYESPREWSNMGTMACCHRRYNLGDVQPSDAEEYVNRLAMDAGYEDTYNRCENAAWHFSRSRNAGEDSGWQDRIARIQETAKAKALENYVILPLYLYDHGGITMCTTGFSCPWDSGQVGIIHCDLATARVNFCRPDATWDTLIDWTHGEKITLREGTRRNLVSEVTAYDQYLTGDVWWYCVESSEDGGETWEQEDSCGGFYGHDYAESEAKSALESAIKQDKADRRKAAQSARKERAERFLMECRDIVTV